MILAVDTSGPRVVVAAADPAGGIRFARAGTRARGHAEEIALLAAEALALGPLTQVVVGRGPGSFTGLRVGLCFAQILGWARDVPVSGLCSLDVVAAQHDLRDGWVVMDARRGELYVARYAEGRRITEPDVLSRADAQAATRHGVVVGDGPLLEEADRRAAGTTTLAPDWLGRCAQQLVASGAGEPATPLYLRRPDVTMRSDPPKPTLDPAGSS